jgi:hypothetical protein
MSVGQCVGCSLSRRKLLCRQMHQRGLSAANASAVKHKGASINSLLTCAARSMAGASAGGSSKTDTRRCCSSTDKRMACPCSLVRSAPSWMAPSGVVCTSTQVRVVSVGMMNLGFLRNVPCRTDNHNRGQAGGLIGGLAPIQSPAKPAFTRLATQDVNDALPPNANPK